MVKHIPAMKENTLFDGGKWPEYPIVCHWQGAWVDDGPSPAGNAGPYLKLPVMHHWEGYAPERLVHRIYLKPKLGKPVSLHFDEAAGWVFTVAGKK